MRWTAPKTATYRLMVDLLATVPRRDRATRARLLVALSREALALGDDAHARRHLNEALAILVPTSSPSEPQG